MECVREWFAQHDWKPFEFQEEVWRAYLRGESGLIHAATGTGKTYAAWLGPILEWLEQYPAAPPRRGAAPLTVLWITPLRALAGDTEAALRAPVEDLGLPWTVESRTGDTSARVRARQQQRLPTALVTTPESLSLLLTRDDAPSLFDHLELVVVDEWHELMASKRGVQTELALARLRRFRPGLQTLGLSATLGNLEVARDTLLGLDASGRPRPGRVFSGLVPKALEVDALIPETMERFPWSGQIGLRLLPEVIRAIEEGESALVFTNTRATAEIWYQAMLEARPDWAGIMALHHGSLDRKTREWVEDGLREGKLRCVVCTSTLDLGVDFTPVDRVIQIGSPKSVGRLIQRAGRSGHQPGAISRLTCVPTNALELVDVAAARSALDAREIEARRPVERPLDLLAQHAVTVALGGGFRSDELLAEVRTAAAFRDLGADEWRWVLDFITRGGNALQAYPEYSKVMVRGRRVSGHQSYGRDAPPAVHRHDRERIGDEGAVPPRASPGLGGGIVHRPTPTRRPLHLRRPTAAVRPHPRDGGIRAEVEQEDRSRAPLVRRQDADFAAAGRMDPDQAGRGQAGHLRRAGDDRLATDPRGPGRLVAPTGHRRAAGGTAPVPGRAPHLFLPGRRATGA